MTHGSRSADPLGARPGLRQLTGYLHLSAHGHTLGPHARQAKTPGIPPPPVMEGELVHKYSRFPCSSGGIILSPSVTSRTEPSCLSGNLLANIPFLLTYYRLPPPAPCRHSLQVFSWDHLQDKLLPLKEKKKGGGVGNSLAVQRLRLPASTARGAGSIPGRGTKIHMLSGAAKILKKKQTTSDDVANLTRIRVQNPLCHLSKVRCSTALI